MRTRVRRWGNSLGIRIPGGLADELQLIDGTEVELELDGGRLVVRPAMSLDALVARITPENLPEMELDGPPRGNEAW